METKSLFVDLVRERLTTVMAAELATGTAVAFRYVKLSVRTFSANYVNLCSWLSSKLCNRAQFSRIAEDEILD